MHAVRHLAVADDAGVLAFGAFETQVQVWRRDPPERIGSFGTVLQFGGERLELSCDGTRCYAAAYHVHGVACYDTCTGRLLWQRKDLKKVQALRRSLSGDGVYCFFDAGPAHLLSGTTGETMAKHAGMRGLVQSPFAPVDLEDRKEPELRARDGRLVRKIPRSTFAVLSACFSPDFLLISEAGGGLRCFDAGTGDEAWRFAPAEGEHFLGVAYSQSSGCFHGVAWAYQAGGPQRLFRIGADGIVQALLSIGTPAITAFAGSGLVTSEGELIDLDSLGSRRLWPLEA